MLKQWDGQFKPHSGLGCMFVFTLYFFVVIYGRLILTGCKPAHHKASAYIRLVMGWLQTYEDEETINNRLAEKLQIPNTLNSRLSGIMVEMKITVK
jgi:hypothetical protein